MYDKMSYTINMDSKKLEILMTAVDLGSFIKAAEVVGYTQSGLTHMMDSLEKEVGFALLKRSHSGIELTKEGKILEPLIKDCLKANALLESSINELKSSAKSTIKVAAYASIAMHWMPEILYRFKRICPDVSVELQMVDHALEPFELLEKGLCDVIFASKQDYDKLNWIPLYEEKMYAILPKDYPLENKKSFPIKNFKNSVFLMPYGKFDIDVEKIMKPLNIEMNTEVSKVDDETLIRMVSRGLGISMMSELMIRGRTDDVLCIPVSPVTKRQLGMGYSLGKPKDSILKLQNCVIDYLKEK
ncbi:MAG: LysR family transcriptional regulator [Erysipelotrichaceae bacterium]|nr:LysR family transcriptional regulator [Erysipelotrichaceae bacterium]